MSTFSEGDLQISFPSGLKVYKFDGEDHGLSHCMKAVDFIVDDNDSYLFIEFKDPENPQARSGNIKKFYQEFFSRSLCEALKQKYRDSFLYHWALAQPEKPIYYYVLVAIESLTAPALLSCTDDLKRMLPLYGPKTGRWRRSIVARCAVFNIAAWNHYLYQFPIRRLSGSTNSQDLSADRGDSK